LVRRETRQSLVALVIGDEIKNEAFRNRVDNGESGEESLLDVEFEFEINWLWREEQRGRRGERGETVRGEDRCGERRKGNRPCDSLS
jgi:hypothetical protein